MSAFPLRPILPIPKSDIVWPIVLPSSFSLAKQCISDLSVRCQDLKVFWANTTSGPVHHTPCLIIRSPHRSCQAKNGNRPKWKARHIPALIVQPDRSAFLGPHLPCPFLHRHAQYPLLPMRAIFLKLFFLFETLSRPLHTLTWQHRLPQQIILLQPGALRTLSWQPNGLSIPTHQKSWSIMSSSRYGVPARKFRSG